MAYMTTAPLAHADQLCAGCLRPAWQTLAAKCLHPDMPLCRECALDAIVALAAALRREEE